MSADVTPEGLDAQQLSEGPEELVDSLQRAILVRLHDEGVGGSHIAGFCEACAELYVLIQRALWEHHGLAALQERGVELRRERDRALARMRNANAAAGRIIDELSREAAALQDRLKKVEGALPDPGRLEWIAGWLDILDKVIRNLNVPAHMRDEWERTVGPIVDGRAVQRDLRIWAAYISALNDSPSEGTLPEGYDRPPGTCVCSCHYEHSECCTSCHPASEGTERAPIAAWLDGGADWTYDPGNRAFYHR